MPASLSARDSGIRSAATAAEISRLSAKGATRVWMVLFIPGGAALFILLCYVLQKATGLPFYDVLGMGECTPSTMNSDDDDAKARCARERDQYTSSQRAVARIAIFIAVAGIVYFLYEQFQNGLGGGLFGGEAASSPVLQMREVLNAGSDQLMASSEVHFEMARAHQLPLGTADPARLPHTPHTIVGAANAHATPSFAPASAGTASGMGATGPTSARVTDAAQRYFGDFAPTATPSSGGGIFDVQRPL